MRKRYEIWIGNYHLGQGHHGSTEPELIDVVRAIDFKTACFKHELQSHLDRINQGEAADNLNSQDYQWWYKPETNSNSWIGKYYESKEEAQKSFEKG